MIKIYDNIFDKNLRYAGLDKCETNNGIGFGVTFFTQYCTHHCKGCHNKSTWDKNGGLTFNEKIYNELFEALNKSYINRLTLSGGDPLDNLLLSNYISINFKNNFPNKQLWIYTGYIFEDIQNKDEYKQILQLCDVLIDGPFILEQRDITLKFRGSKNQRIWKKENNIWEMEDN